MQIPLRRTLIGLLLFGISFGYVEAAVVVYLRTLYEPYRKQLVPDRPAGEVYPLADPRKLREQTPQLTRLVGIEVFREAGTLLMIAAAALLVAGERNLWLPAFAVAFGTWDIFFYVFLKVLIGWPASPMTWDVLFLIPVPWSAPVLAPVIVSMTVIACGVIALQRPVSPRAIHWLGMMLGCAIILASFMLDYRNVMAGNLPKPFAWWLLAVGDLVGAGAFAAALRAASIKR